MGGDQYIRDKLCQGPALAMHLWHLLGWFATKLWDWGAVLFIVTALWTFGAIGIGAALTEPIPSAMEIVGAASLVWMGGLFLLFRILHSAWKTTELTSVFQKMMATVIALVLFVAVTRLGSGYILEKIPLLTINLSQSLPRPIGPPPDFSSTSATPPKEQQRINVGSINVQLPTKAGDDATANVGISLAGTSAREVSMEEMTATWYVYPTDVTTQASAEETLWGMMEKHAKVEPPFPLVMPTNNKTLNLPLVLRSVTDVQIQLVNAGTRAYYFLCHVKDEKGKTLLELCFRVDGKDQSMYCRSHNGP